MAMLENVLDELQIISKIVFEGNNNVGIHDTSIVGLYGDIYDKCSTINFLIENKEYSGVEVLLRVVFEQKIYLDYICENDSINRGKAYFYNDQMSMIRMRNALLKKGEPGKEIRKFLNMTADQIKVLSGQLNNEEGMKRLKNEFNSCFEHNKPRTWYDFNGHVNSFEGLCIYLKKGHEYDTIYRIFSRNVHGATGFSRFDFLGDILYLNQFQGVQNPQAFDRIASTLLKQSAEIVSKYYFETK
ncbi:MAG: DUF5677 domain-containing protein [Carnobacterium inhibens]|uniref:DUF5677 domain-containing protein n=1 Tax=Carnobacterium inhibens TaxID=147709 RepID=UPI0033146BB0